MCGPGTVTTRRRSSRMPAYRVAARTEATVRLDNHQGDDTSHQSHQRQQQFSVSATV
jgi:hypothetical protein